ncbi:MAG TPA: NADH:flavin oxidoreductase [Firmicutes bacterium]|nr:NADH:flavin oxidoreductase [Bacillota bacterium]
MATYPAIATLKDITAFRNRLGELGLGESIPLVDSLPVPADLALGWPWRSGEINIGNRFCVHPMEGWDGTEDGRPSELVTRRWIRFGQSGAKLIWGGEAVAVRHDGRANPNQLRLGPDTVADFARLLQDLKKAHAERYGTVADLLVGIQLTHSGRFSRPNRKDKLEPRIAFHHPVLDRRCGIAPDDDQPILTDMEAEELIGDFVRAAKLAREAGFDFVDIKHCHGYLLHEFLSARIRPGRYGGDFEGRTRLGLEIIAAVKRECPGLLIGVRLSVFDLVPFRPDPALSTPGKPGPGIPETYGPGEEPHLYAFGMSAEDPCGLDLSEPIRFIRLLGDAGVFMVNLTAGSPYYNPHIQRPALFPPSDGYQPPEDPLVGVARQMAAVKAVKAAVPDMPVIGTGYTYLQEFIPHVAEAAVREGWTDFVGLGRMILPYPDLPADILAGKRLERRRLCRTFSDCTTAPRKGLVSGCYPLDGFYKDRPEYAELRRLKSES